MKNFVIIIIVVILSTLKFAVIFWGSIRFLDGSQKNKFSLALLFGFILALFAIIPGSFIFGFIPLFVIMMLLVNYYRVSLLKSVLIIIILIVTDVLFGFIVASII